MKSDYSYSNILGQMLLMLPVLLQASALVKSDEKERQWTSMDQLLDKASSYLGSIGFDTDNFENVEGHVQSYNKRNFKGIESFIVHKAKCCGIQKESC